MVLGASDWSAKADADGVSYASVGQILPDAAGTILGWLVIT